MYDALTALEGRPETAVIMTGNISRDPPEWNPHFRTKSHLPENLDYSNWKIRSSGDKFSLVNEAVNHIVKDDKRTDDFMKAEKSMSGMVSIVRSHQRIQEIAPDVVFLQHVGAAVRKAKSPVVDKKKTEKKIRELIGRSIDSEEIIDVYAMAGIAKPDISILDEEFLAGAKEKKSGHEIKVELLRQILNNEIKVKMPKNIRKYTSLKEEVDKVIEKYHNNAIDSYTTIMELYERAKEMQQEDRRSKELGLSEEELAFYDILARHKDAIKDYSLIKELVHKIVKAVEKNLQLDWYKKPDAQAAIRSAVKGVLRKNVELKELKTILKDIMEQAKGQYEEWPMVG